NSMPGLDRPSTVARSATEAARLSSAARALVAFTMLVMVACGSRSLKEGDSQRLISDHLMCQPVCEKQPFSDLESVELRIRHGALRVTWTVAGPIPLDSGSVVPPAEVVGWGL